MNDYCATQHESGWYCVLKKGHSGTEHLSLDNSKLWHGSPGAPVKWDANEVLLNETEHKLSAATPKKARPQAAEINQAKTLGFTGELCANCGSPNTIRNGKCLLCTSCKATGECG